MGCLHALQPASVQGDHAFIRVDRAATGPIAVTVMVGDGINDAPALAAADVGVAIGARGATACSEAADVVLVVDRLDRLVEAIRIARRSRSIGLQSVFLGMGLSIAGMGFAAGGLLSPVAGALFQEIIDVIVILNALRALKGGRLGRSSGASKSGFGEQCRAEHRQLWPEIKRIRHIADRLDVLPARLRVSRSNRFTGSLRKRSCRTMQQRMPPSIPRWRGLSAVTIQPLP